MLSRQDIGVTYRAGYALKDMFINSWQENGQNGTLDFEGPLETFKWFSEEVNQTMVKIHPLCFHARNSHHCTSYLILDTS